MEENRPSVHKQARVKTFARQSTPWAYQDPRGQDPSHNGTCVRQVCGTRVFPLKAVQTGSLIKYPSVTIPRQGILKSLRKNVKECFMNLNGHAGINNEATISTAPSAFKRSVAETANFNTIQEQSSSISRETTRVFVFKLIASECRVTASVSDENLGRSVNMRSKQRNRPSERLKHSAFVSRVSYTDQ